MKKITALILMFIIITMTINCYAMTNNDEKLTKDDVISIVKNKLGDIKYDDFNIQYREFTNKDSVWILNYTKNDIYQNTLITIDAKNGDILKYDFMTERKEDKTISKADAFKAAENFLSKVKPKNLSKYKLDNNIFNEETPYVFNFKWRREENGVKFLYDTINISVDKKSGDVLHYSYNWTDGDLPSLKNVIDINEATKLFKEYLKPKLVYTIIYNRNKGDVKLVYVSPSSQYMINAYNGNIIDVYGNKVNLKPSGINHITLDKAFKGSGRPVTKEEALKIASKYVGKDYELKNTSYFEKYAGLNLSVWTFAWNKINGIGYTHVAVNAKTGNVIDVMTSTKNDSDIIISRESALQKAEAFVKENFKDVLPYLDFSNNNEYTSQSKVYGYHFIFPLKQYNIPFMNNGVTVEIDGKGNISAYTYKNYDIPIPFPSNIITQDTITNKYLKSGGFSIKYFKPLGKDLIPVYTVDEPMYSNIDAVTGEIIRPY